MTDKNIYDEDSDFSNSGDDFISPSNDTANTNILQNLKYYQEYDLRVSKRKTVIAVDITILNKIREKCKAIQGTTFPFEEILLGIASLLLGASLNALFAGIKLEVSTLSVFSYVVFPMISVGCGTIYFFLKRTKIEDAKQMAKEIADYITDIEEQCDSIEDLTTNVK